MDTPPDSYSTTTTRWGILAIMPRIEGVSGRSTSCWSLRKPNPRNTRRCFSGQPMPLRTQRIRIVPGSSSPILYLPRPAPLRNHQAPEQGAGCSPARRLLRCCPWSFRRRLSFPELSQRLHRGPDDIVRIGGAKRLRDHILHTGSLENRPHRSAGDNSGSLRRRLQEHLPGPVVPEHLVWNRVLVPRDFPQVLLGGLDAFPDRRRNLLGLPGRKTHHALLRIADDNQGAETQILSPLDDLRHAIDGNHLV